jgi:predicted regulator of Ras-like GTPase activity (Roadblock/LC7/MglB family)
MEPDTSTSTRVGQLDWLLDDLVRRVAHITKAVILSQDGMTLGASDTLERDDAEHLAALAAGFQSLARGAGRHFGGGTARQTIIEMESGFLLVTAAGNGTCLAVITGPGADLGLVAYEMAILVKRSGEHGTPASRSIWSPPCWPRAPSPTQARWHRSTSACSSSPGCRPRLRTSPRTSTSRWGWSGSSWPTCGNSAWS